MAEEIKEYDFECVRIKRGREESYRFIFDSEIGEHYLELGEEYYDLFRPGKKYSCIVKASGIPDFLGQEDKMENVCTVTYRLEKLLQNGVIIWEKK